jgi:predicted TIM-barrel fold metal-dependent hydrolase
MVIDFHAHISTVHSHLPPPDGDYYKVLGSPNPASQFLGQITQEAWDAMAERLRTPGALRAYRQAGPLIYTEMSRRMAAGDTNALLATMAENGVQQSVVVGMDPWVPTEDVLQACALLGGVLIPFGSVDPNVPDYLERFTHLLTLPISGIKFHSELQRLPLNSPKLYAMLETLARSQRPYLPVYLHTGNFPIYKPSENPWNQTLPRLVATFPTLTFVCGHAGWDSPSSALRTALSWANLYLETSWQPSHLIRRLCDKLGPERLLFGSDFPLFSQKRALRNVRLALTETELQSVVCFNARRLLRL